MKKVVKCSIVFNRVIINIKCSISVILIQNDISKAQSSRQVFPLDPSQVNYYINEIGQNFLVDFFNLS